MAELSQIPANIPDVPKVDLHVHLGGSITPAMVERLAVRNHLTIPAGLIKDGEFCWKGDGTPGGNLNAFLDSHEAASSFMRTAQDYTDVAYDYLKRSAAEGCIYAEITISAAHAEKVGLTYIGMVEAIAKGVRKAKNETGIEARLISTCVRHYGAEKALEVGKATKANPHELVTAFGMAGDENAHTVKDFKAAFEAAALPYRTAHAGEAAGPDSVRNALETLGLRRFGHMVRACEDEKLIRQLVAANAVPEVCVSSNLVLKVFNDVAAHPLRRMFDAGLKVTLGSDDPTFFRTSIGKEYQIAKEQFGFTDAELLKISRNAIEEAFVDEKTRKKLLKKLAPIAA